VLNQTRYVSITLDPGGVVGRPEAGPAAELRLGSEGEGHLGHHCSCGLDLHQAPGYGGGDDVTGDPGVLGHGVSLTVEWGGVNCLSAVVSARCR